jgi:Spy/CpxP family protein refolding chaperone
MKYTVAKWFIAAASIGVLALAFNAYAGPGYGYRGHGSGGCPGGYFPEMTEEQRQKVQTERERFFKDTEDLRSQIYEKEIAFEAVLAKKDLDVDKARALQKELSSLRAQFNEKRFEHVLKIKQINPELGRGFMADGRRGGGKRYGRAGTGCGDCPYRGGSGNY